MLEEIYGKADILLPDEFYALADTAVTGAGTASIGSGSSTVTGVGTNFKASMEGGSITVGTYTGTLLTWVSATQFTVSPANAGAAVAAGTAYTITEKEQMNIWNEAVMGRGWALMRMHDWVTTGGIGTHWKEKLRLEGLGVSTTNTLQLRLLDFNIHEIKTKTTTLKASSRTGHGAAKVLCIGDSRFEGGEAIAQAIDRLATITSVGNRFSNNVYHEARGGFSVSLFNNGDNGIYSSHFMFPVGVTPANYVGNSEWLRIAAAVQSGTNTNPTDVYATQNFSRLLNNGGGSLQYSNTTGYPLTPTNGMVIFNPTLAPGLKFQTYNSGSWATTSPQPTLWEWNFGSYLTRYAVVQPTHVFITLGANDFATYTTAPDFTAWLASVNAWVTSIHAVNSSIKVFIGLPEQNSDTDGTGAIYGALYTAEIMRYVYQRQQAAIMDFFGTAAMRATNTFIAPFALVVDPSDGWTDNTTATKRSKYSSKTETLKTDGIHESIAVGKKQVGDMLAACVAAYS
jgi:lysophospholipase L1-like esterase